MQVPTRSWRRRWRTAFPSFPPARCSTWLDGRNSSSFGALAWNAGTLTFTIAVGAGANGLRAMVPTPSAAGQLTGIERGGSAVAFTTETIKGVAYAIFEATAGAYVATYGVDQAGPVISDVSAVPDADGTATIAWTTSEAADSEVDVRHRSGRAQLERDRHGARHLSLDRAHRADANTTYYYRVKSADGAGNETTSPLTGDPPLSFTTPSAAFTDTTVADFSAGDLGSCATGAYAGDGEVTLAPTLAAEFSGTALPAGWSGATWGAGGGASVSGGSLVVDGARAVTDLPGFGPGRSLEFVATFGAAQFQHVGLVSDFDSNPPWILFSTRIRRTTSLPARTLARRRRSRMSRPARPTSSGSSGRRPRSASSSTAASSQPTRPPSAKICA